MMFPFKVLQAAADGARLDLTQWVESYYTPLTRMFMRAANFA